jgi:hypothetical protein
MNIVYIFLQESNLLIDKMHYRYFAILLSENFPSHASRVRFID